MAAPSFVAVGAQNSGTTGSVTYALPAGIAADDVLIAGIESAATGGVTTSTTGWSDVAGSPRAQGSNTLAVNALIDKYVAGDGNLVGAASGNHQTGAIAAFRGVDPTTPVDTTSNNSGNSAALSGSSITTTVADTLVVLVAAWGADDATAQFSSVANASLTGVTVHYQAGTINGNGGGILIASGVKATAGTVAAWSATLGVSQTWAAIVVALKPAPSSPAYAADGTFSGDGALTTTSTPGAADTATLSGSGTLTSTGTPSSAATATLSGSGALNLTGTPSTAGTVALAGAGTLAPAGTPAATSSASFSGNGTLSTSGTPAVTRPVTLSGTGTLSASCSVTVAQAASLTGSGTLTASAGSSGSASVGLTGSGALTTSGTPALTRTLSLTGAGTLATTGRPSITTGANMTGVGTLAFAGRANAQVLADLTGSGSLATAGASQQGGIVLLEGTGVLEAQAGGLPVGPRPELVIGAPRPHRFAALASQQAPGITPGDLLPAPTTAGPARTSRYSTGAPT